MQFTIRDIIALTIIVALLIVHFKDRADTLERFADSEADVHEHVQRIDWRLDALEGWSTYVDRTIDEDGRRGVDLDGTIADMQTDIGALEGRWPKRVKP